MEANDKQILEEFRKAASKASMYYADDSGREWFLAREQESIARSLYQQHPHLQAEMLALMKKQLWIF